MADSVGLVKEYTGVWHLVVESMSNRCSETHLLENVKRIEEATERGFNAHSRKV